MAPDHYIIGGGASKHLEQFRDAILCPVPLRVARFRNEAGIIGAAAVAISLSEKD